MLKGYKFRLEATGDEVPRLLDATTKSTSEPLIISNGKEEYMQWWQYQAIFGYNLTNIRIYCEGYLDKVMISGVNAYGQRERVYLDKYPKRKKSRNRWFHTKAK